MHHPLSAGDAVAWHNFLTCAFEGFFDEPRHAPRRWVQPHRLSQNLRGVQKLWNVFDTGSAASENSGEFFVKFLFDVGISCEEPERPRNCIRSRFVAGK